MIKFHIGGRLAAGVLVSVVAIAVSGIARADCDAFPKVAWWGELTHDTVRDFVDDKYDGDWAPYLEKWDIRRIKLKRLLDNEMSVTIEKTGTVLDGASLKAFIENVEKRLKIVRCLAAVDDSSGFDTSEEGSSLKPASK